MKYDFKSLQELGWFVAVAVGTALVQALVAFDPDAITDWRAWLVAIGAGAVRAAAGAVISWLGKNAVGGAS